MDGFHDWPLSTSNIGNNVIHDRFQLHKYRHIFTSRISISILASAPILTIIQIIAVALPDSSVQNFWIATAYYLSNAAFQPLLATFSEAFGRGRVVLASTLVFITGSAIAGTASSPSALLVGRTIQGVGSAGLSTNNLILPIERFPLAVQKRYIRILEGVQAVGFIFGPVIGGVISQSGHWRWVFYFNIPFCLIILVAAPFAFGLRGGPPKQGTWLKGFDFIGAFLFVISLALFVLAVSWGGILFTWSSASTVLPLIIGIIGLIVTGVFEALGATDPFMRHRLFYRRSANVAYFCTFIQSFVLFAQLYFLAIYLEAIKKSSIAATGGNLLALLLPIIPAFIAAGVLNSRSGTYVRFVWAGIGIETLATGLLIVLDTSTSSVAWPMIAMVSGVGHGFIIASLDYATQVQANDADVMYSASMSAFLRSLGMCAGVGLSSSVFLNLMSDKLEQLKEPSTLCQHALELIIDLKQIPDTWSSKALILQSFVHGLKGVFGFLTALMAIALVSSFFMRDGRPPAGPEGIKRARSPIPLPLPLPPPPPPVPAKDSPLTHPPGVYIIDRASGTIFKDDDEKTSEDMCQNGRHTRISPFMQSNDREQHRNDGFHTHNPISI